MGRRLVPSTLNISLHQRGNSQTLAHSIQIQPETTTHIFPGWIKRINLTQRKLSTQTEALLVPISNYDNSNELVPIPITSDTLTIGSDPELANISIEDPSIESLHAMIRKKNEGHYQIIDQGSTAGTWVNYLPIQEDSKNLEHGDQVHFGRIGFIFTFRNPNYIRKPIITLETIPNEPEELSQ
jgi:pSer/pThr/pTyr-binding forkhead associated (FHA) protein